MPYILPERRESIDYHLAEVLPFIENEGDLNYAVTKLCDMYLCRYGDERYSYYNEVMGVMVCALLELYRRKIAKYEDKKCARNGDVYDWISVLKDVTL